MEEQRILKEYRCYVNKKLLCKASWDVQVEIINTSNRITNYTWPSRVSQDIWPKWKDFQQHSIDLHCSGCKRLMWRAIWNDWLVEIKCKYCHSLNLYDVKEIQSGRLNSLSNKQREAVLNSKKNLR